MAQDATPHVFPVLTYRDPDAAIEWLRDAFGLEPLMVARNENGAVMHAELRLGQGIVMLGGAGEAVAPAAIYAYVDDPEGHYDRARRAGAEVTREIETTFYDSHEYSARDPEGHQWHFGDYLPSLTPQPA